MTNWPELPAVGQTFLSAIHAIQFWDWTSLGAAFAPLCAMCETLSEM